VRLRQVIDSPGILIAMNGLVGNNTHRPLDTNVFIQAKQFFRAAYRKRLIAESPFADMKNTTVRSRYPRVDSNHRPTV
jgi:hypothetical protein